jgi:hypothetical protein
LEEYNKHIEDLKNEMDDATRSADLIRLDIYLFFLPFAFSFSPLFLFSKIVNDDE